MAHNNFSRFNGFFSELLQIVTTIPCDLNSDRIGERLNVPHAPGYRVFFKSLLRFRQLGGHPPKIGHKKWPIRPFLLDLHKIASENTGYCEKVASKSNVSQK